MRDPEMCIELGLLEAEKRDWEQGAAIIAQFFAVKPEDLA
jgi:hypothetical protein